MGKRLVCKGEINQIGLDFGHKLCGTMFHPLHLFFLNNEIGFGFEFVV